MFNNIVRLCFKNKNFYYAILYLHNKNKSILSLSSFNKIILVFLLYKLNKKYIIYK